jgi:hypothetical protein
MKANYSLPVGVRQVTLASLEKHLSRLEVRFDELQKQLGSTVGREKKDWRRTIGVFTDNEGVQEILRDAMRLRETNRKNARKKRTTRRGADRRQPSLGAH